MSTTSPIITFAIRGTQALFATIVFGLSTALIKGHEVGTLPSTLGFAAFVGGLSFIGALLSIAAIWIQALQGQIGVVVDAVVASINLAGGLLMAIKLKGVSCKKIDFYDTGSSHGAKHWIDTVYNEILCGGFKKDQDPGCFYYTLDGLNVLVSRCKMSSADSAFMFLTVIVVSGAAVLAWMRLKRGY